MNQTHPLRLVGGFSGGEGARSEVRHFAGTQSSAGEGLCVGERSGGRFWGEEKNFRILEIVQHEF